MHGDLTILQKKFSDALLDLSKIDVALSTLHGDPDLKRERFGFYRGNIAAIWQQTCASAFPVLKRLTGTEFFDELARAYGRACPSQSGNLTEFAAAMPEYIQTLDNCQPYPYLSDIAALEWLVHRAYYSESRLPATLAQLAAVPADRLSNVCLQIQPGCALLVSPWAVADIWLAHQKEEVIFPAQLQKNNWCLVWQSGWNVQVSSISAAAHAALHALREGATLGMALDQAMDRDPDFEIQTAIADWFQKQLVTSIV